MDSNLLLINQKYYFSQFVINLNQAFTLTITTSKLNYFKLHFLIIIEKEEYYFIIAFYLKFIIIILIKN